MAAITHAAEPPLPVFRAGTAGHVIFAGMRRARTATALMLLALAAGAVPAMRCAAAGDLPAQAVPPVDASTIANPEAAAATIPGVKKEDIRPTPVAGVFEVRRGADIVYMSGDGQYVFTGDLYNVPSHNNLTEAHRRVLRRSSSIRFPNRRW